MKNRTAARAKQTKLTAFQPGQIWRVDDLNLAVTSVGKTLVHYKRYKTQPKGVQTTLSSKPDLEKYLASRKAVLVTEA